ncbi:CBS domain-containing protein [Desulfovibrio aminophilus]|nr:CBS domain-containing protein [Desulfovibrio aminophilus]MCM0754362.1 CBS domain-containing protein [Desulfovibrio aminophilus]
MPQGTEPKIAAPTVITAHANADFDALAAMIAASRLYPGAVLIFPGSQEKNLRNFYIQSTTYLFNFRNFKEIDQGTVRLLVVVDTRQKSRLAHVGPLLDNPAVEIHAYDHHPDSDEDVAATLSMIKPWGSTTAILVAEMRERGIVPLPEEATVMGLGLFEDTGSFSFDSTAAEDFEAAGWLRRNGMDLGVVTDLLSRDLDSEQVKILGELLETATSQEINGVNVVMAEASTDDFVGDFAFLAHKFMDMENIRVLFALGRMGDRIHLVARSRHAEVDVGEICGFFGGGGHAYAASATIKNKTLAEVKDELFALLYSHVNPQMVVENLMSKPPVVIEKSRPMKAAVELMTRFGLKGVPVVEDGGMRCVGLLEHKIADKAMTHKLGEVAVKEYMLREFLSVPPRSDLQEVMEIILGKRQRLVPVVAEDGELRGVITRTDLVNLLVEEPSRIPESLSPDRKRERNIRTLMFNRLPAAVFELLKKAGELGQDMGCEVFTVGGFVRDILLARVNLDIDLVVEGDGIRFARELVQRLGGRAKTHKKFKTAVVILPGGRRIDVATARLEYYEYPAALPTVELSSIKMDLYRRDFTINALAVHLNPQHFGRLVDFFGAQRDIKEKTIRVIHSLSFVEDPTRILRAVRFEQRFGFRIGSQTARLIKNALQLNLFSRLSGNRVFHELQLILDEESPLNCLSRMQELGLLEAIHPQMVLDPVKARLVMEIGKVHNWHKLLYLKPSAVPWKLYLLGLAQGVDGEQALDVCRRLGLSQRDERDFLALRESIGQVLGRLMAWKEDASPLSELYFCLDTLPLEGVLFLMARSRREEIRKHISQFLTNPASHAIEVTGRDLKRLRIPEGPVYARILRALRQAKIDGRAEGRKEQLQMVRALKREWRLAEDSGEDESGPEACPPSPGRVG